MIRFWVGVLCLALLSPATRALGQPTAEDWPGLDTLSARLADPETRDQTLGTLAVIMNARQSGAALSAESLSRDLAWLERLQLRFGAARPRPPVLDPAGWLLYQKVSEQQLPSGALLQPAPLSLDNYLRAAFSRESERVAASVLPELLWQVEAEATRFWAGLLQQAAAPDGGLEPVEALARARWADDGGARTDTGDGIDGDLDALVADVIAPGPPDASRAWRIRFHIHQALAEATGAERVQWLARLRLATLIEGLHENRFTAFAEGLVAVAARLLQAEPTDGTGEVQQWLVEYLPVMSSAYAREFALVDPAMNSALASVFDVAQYLAGGPERGDVAAAAAELADAVAQLALLIPDIEYYFDLPVRDSIAGTIEACLGMMARRDAEGRSAMTREIFDDCLDSLVELANTEARGPGLAGDPDGPFGLDELQRELSVTSVQRINYGLGYLNERYETACTPPQRPLPNPLEYATLATLMSWFGERSPVYFQAPENEARLQRMMSVGWEIVEQMAGQVDCFSGSGSGLSDPVSRGLSDYRNALIEFNGLLGETIREFRSEVLAPGADIVLEEGAGQSTTYRPDGLLIGPCDAAQICEMSGQLSSTRALLGLFPDSYLVADQSGMGEIQLCYENVQWVDRRSEPVRRGDTNVANYYGHLSFDLRGRLATPTGEVDVFAYRFRSPDEYHYLFAAADEEVLADSCPMEWVGTRIVTPMARSRVGIVPNRLTYLAAPRMLPSRLLSLNWDRGAEWRDWFITELGVEPLEPRNPPEIQAEVSEHLQNLYRREQAAVYQRVLHGAAAAGGADEARRQLQAVSTQKGLLRMLIMLFYPQSVVDSDSIRGAIAGQAGLLSDETLQRLRQGGVPVININDISLRRLDALEAAWRAQPEGLLRVGSIGGSLTLALLRLEKLYADNFAPAAEPVTLSLPEPADG